MLATTNPTTQPQQRAGQPRGGQRRERRAVITSAAALCKALRESGTGAEKLDLIRDLLQRKPNADSEEAYAVLEANPTKVMQRTLDKARSLIETGEAPPVEQVGTGGLNIEDMILADRTANIAAGLYTPKPGEAGVQGQSDQQRPGPQTEESIRRKVQAEIRAKVEQDVRREMELERRSLQAEADEVARQAALKEQEQKNKTPSAPKLTPSDAETEAARLAQMEAERKKQGTQKPGNQTNKPGGDK